MSVITPGCIDKTHRVFYVHKHHNPKRNWRVDFTIMGSSQRLRSLNSRNTNSVTRWKYFRRQQLDATSYHIDTPNLSWGVNYSPRILLPAPQWYKAHVSEASPLEVKDAKRRSERERNIYSEPTFTCRNRTGLLRRITLFGDN